MTPELQTKLYEKYPKIFADKDKSMQESCMFWGIAVGDGWYNIIDILCGTIQQHIDWSIKSHNITLKHNEMVTTARNGDLTLFNKHFEKVDEKWRNEYLNQILTTSNDSGEIYGSGLRKVPEIIPQLVADQVKEKFAGLRFYHHGGDSFCDGVIALAEGMSTHTCEECGGIGKTGGTGWIKTLCEKHRKKIDDEQYSHHQEHNE